MDWFAAVITVIGVQLMTRGHKCAWVICGLSQLIQLPINLSAELYGFVVLSCILLAQNIYGYLNHANTR